MPSVLFLIIYYQYFLTFFLPKDFGISLPFFHLQQYTLRKKHRLEKEHKREDNILERIMKIIGDKAFFRWLGVHEPEFEQYEKQVLDSPHIDIVVKGHLEKDFEVYRQVNKKKYSKVV